MGDKISEEIVYNGKYFFISEEKCINRKTPIYVIYDKNSVCIGKIKWYGAWRKFCFFPEEGSIWDNTCLGEVITLLCDYNENRLENKIQGEIENE